MAGKYIERDIEGKTDVEILKQAVKNKMNIMLVGDTGSGKTHLVRHTASELKMPYFRVSFDRGITIEDLIGEYKPVNNQFEWGDGILTKMVRDGGMFVADEINSASPEMIFFLNMLLDDERKIVLRQHNGEEIEAHKDFIFIATINPSDLMVYEGIKRMNMALLDRFDLILTIGYSKEVEKKLIGDERLLILADKLRYAFNTGKTNSPVSTRALMQFERNIKLFGEEIATMSFSNKFQTEDREYINEIVSLVLSGKEDKE